MDHDELFTKSRWDILREISKGQKSATEISKKNGQSLPNTVIQLHLLEAQGIIKKIKKRPDGKKSGKPQIPYALNHELASLHLLKEGMAEKKTIKLQDTEPLVSLALSAIASLGAEEAAAIIRFCSRANLAIKAQAIGYLRSHDKEIELVVVIEKVEEYRSKHSVSSIEVAGGKTKKIISWSHTRKELEEGVRRKEDYFVNLIASKELLDKEGILRELRTL